MLQSAELLSEVAGLAVRALVDPVYAARPDGHDGRQRALGLTSYVGRSASRAHLSSRCRHATGSTCCSSPVGLNRRGSGRGSNAAGERIAKALRRRWGM